MIIALDYDDTYDRDPVLWNHLIGLAAARRHSVVIVTMRYEHEPIALALAGVDVPIFYTGRQAKVPYMADLGIDVHVWIDDDPYALIDLACPERPGEHVALICADCGYAATAPAPGPPAECPRCGGVMRAEP